MNLFYAEQTIQDTVRYHISNSPILRLQNQKNQPLELTGWFFWFISYTFVVTIKHVIGIP